MFNPERVAKWMWGILRVLGPLTLALVLMAKVAVSYRQGIPFSEWPTDFSFWLSLLVATAPGLVVIAGTFWVAGAFVRSVYGLESIREGTAFAFRSMFGTPSFAPYLILQEGGEKQLSDRTEPLLKNVGGPGNLLLYNDVGVVLEQNGELTRTVVGPTFEALERFERVYATVDLRPREWAYPVSAMTKEGIPVTCTALVRFSIDDGDREPSDEAPFPALEESVFKAATCAWVREEDRFEDKLDWAGRLIISNTEGTLRTLLARVRLDQLVPAEIIPPDAGREQAVRQQAITRRRLREDLEKVLVQSARPLGVKVLEVTLTDIRVDPEVERQWEDIWRTGWRKWAVEQLETGKAERFEKLEEARVEAQVRMLTQFGQAIQQLQQSGDFSPSSCSVALRFIDAIRMVEAPSHYARVFVPDQALDTLNRLRRLLTETGSVTRGTAAPPS